MTCVIVNCFTRAATSAKNFCPNCVLIKPILRIALYGVLYLFGMIGVVLCIFVTELVVVRRVRGSNLDPNRSRTALMTLLGRNFPMDEPFVFPGLARVFQIQKQRSLFSTTYARLCKRLAVPFLACPL